MIVVDYFSRKPREWMQRLKLDRNIDGVARYLTNNPDDPKCFSPAERDDAFGVGLAVHLVYETTGGSPQFTPGGAAYFTSHQGTYDALEAVRRLVWLTAPKGTLVYFSVDVNIPGAACDAYFTAVEFVMANNGYRAGVYGFEEMVEHARRAYPNVGEHLWQTYGTPRGDLDLWQHEQVTVDGVPVDLNEASVGGWKKGGGPVIFVPKPVGQGADKTIRVGEVAMLQASFMFKRADGSTFNRAIEMKVVSTTPRRFFVTIPPPVDPDADETIVLDAEPAMFVVDVVVP